ncbi:MAG: thioesterase family protein [Candidatus Dormibacteraceae bacterium]
MEGDSGDASGRAAISPAIAPGIERRVEIVIGDRHLTRHVGGRGVFSTPAMIGLMEGCAHESVAPLLSAEQTTVGYEVHVFHRAPADPGETIVVTSRLADVVEHRLTFEVRATRGETLLGEGIHRRAIVSARA